MFNNNQRKYKETLMKLKFQYFGSNMFSPIITQGCNEFNRVSFLNERVMNFDSPCWRMEITNYWSLENRTSKMEVDGEFFLQLEVANSTWRVVVKFSQIAHQA